MAVQVINQYHSKADMIFPTLELDATQPHVAF
jgi:hypothetical protein